ncbi:transglutaminase domain-containing protein [Maribacter sp. 1_MG-2023]|uniref:transglutaminase domain-containing protein n=1 Tax=Maribacter sp. 1_MG-2023 TaxID=3062677 RepID=UPI0026E1970B|nr:transglutaminase domain-containing protein [Maribacter sp. 1_MG-2023]MDO6471327.1 transglutaminase domain-containing protein [Maribacter sp. 1_MG-2023]
MRKFIFLSTLLFSLISFAQRSDFNHIDFKKADSIADYYKDASLRNLPVLTHNLTTSLETDVEKFRAIYTWISTNIANDYTSYVKISTKRKRFAKDRQAFLDWNTSITPKVFKNLLEDRKTACTGYAYLVKEMANLAGFKCDIIDGYGRTPTLLLEEDSAPNHSWNNIKVNEKWYLCDATWSAGQTIIINGTPLFQQDYFDGYFLADAELFAKNHFPIQKEEGQPIKKENLDAFIAGPVIYKEAFLAPIIPIAPVAMHNNIPKGASVTFTLQVPKEFIGNTQLLLNKGGSQKNGNPNIIKKEGKINLVQHFEKKGLYDVHISVEDQLIATYVIKVK